MAQDKIPVTPQHVSSIKKVVDLLGSPKDLADFLGVTRANVYLWINSYQPSPIKHAEKLAAEFPSQISVIELRPDISLYKKYFS